MFRSGFVVSQRFAPACFNLMGMASRLERSLLFSNSAAKNNLLAPDGPKWTRRGGGLDAKGRKMEGFGFWSGFRAWSRCEMDGGGGGLDALQILPVLTRGSARPPLSEGGPRGLCKAPGGGLYEMNVGWFDGLRSVEESVIYP